MPNEMRPQTPPSVAWDFTNGKTVSAHDDDDTPTSPHSPPSSSSTVSPLRTSKKLPSVLESSSSLGTPPRRRGRPHFHLSLLALHSDVDLVAFIFTDPNHVSFATYSTNESTSAHLPQGFTISNSCTQTGARTVKGHGGDDDDDGESDAPPPTLTESRDSSRRVAASERQHRKGHYFPFVGLPSYARESFKKTLTFLALFAPRTTAF
jgi:hypothetical protein